MHPVEFPGSVPIVKPEDMTDEQCCMAWAKYGFDIIHKLFENGEPVRFPPGVYAGIDSEKFSYYMTAWQPNKEDLDALNRGEPIYIKTISKGLPPMAVFTVDENGNGNF